MRKLKAEVQGIISAMQFRVEEEVRGACGPDVHCHTAPTVCLVLEPEPRPAHASTPLHANATHNFLPTPL